MSDTTNPEHVFGETESENRAVIETATRATAPHPLDDKGRLFAVAVPAGGDVTVIDVEDHLEKYRDTPRRKTGTYGVLDVPSFAAYVGKHGNQHTEVWADPVAGKIRAVLDAHPGDIHAETRWEQHAVEYPARQTAEWQAWVAHEGLAAQDKFAEHIEDRLLDIVDPDGSEMLELAQSFQATTGVSFESSKRLNSGERQLEYKESTAASAGRSGNIVIPEKFYLALRPYEGSEAFKVECRFRYRIQNGTLLLGYKITRRDEILRDAFDTLVARVNEALEAETLDMVTPVMIGAGKSR